METFVCCFWVLSGIKSIWCHGRAILVGILVICWLKILDFLSFWLGQLMLFRIEWCSSLLFWIKSCCFSRVLLYLYCKDWGLFFLSIFFAFLFPLSFFHLRICGRSHLVLTLFPPKLHLKWRKIISKINLANLHFDNWIRIMMLSIILQPFTYKNLPFSAREIIGLSLLTFFLSWLECLTGLQRIHVLKGFPVFIKGPMPMIVLLIELLRLELFPVYTQISSSGCYIRFILSFY